MSRPRSLVVALSPVVAVSALVALAALPGGRAQAGQDASPLAGNDGGALYTFESGAAGFSTKTFFYDTGDEVIAFDAHFTPELAEQAIAYLRTESDSPLSTVVITHPNPDKFNGVPAFQAAGAEVVASTATAGSIPGVHDYKKAGLVGAGMFTDETYPPLATVDQTFEGSETLELKGGKTVELRELRQPGVSSN